MVRVAHICRFPRDKNIHSYNGGVASYTRFFIESIMQDPHYTHYIVHDQEYITPWNNINNWGQWRASYFFVRDIITCLAKIKPHIIHVQWELSLFWPLFNNFLLLIVLSICKLFGIYIVITWHHVLDLHLLTQQFINDQGYPLPAWIVRIGTRVLYGMARIFDHHIVHEEPHKQILVQQYHLRDVSVIHHGIQDAHHIDQHTAQKFYNIALQDFTIGFCGYAAAYKDIKLLIDWFALFHKQHPHSHLLIGAGKHPKWCNDQHYTKHYEDLIAYATHTLPQSSYHWIGFVEDNKLDTFYSACDVLVFPYKHSFSSSGPLALSIAHHKPFIFSPVLAPYFPDLTNNVFALDAHSLSSTLEGVYHNKNAYSDIIRMLSIQRKRSTLSTQYLSIYSSIISSNVC